MTHKTGLVPFTKRFRKIRLKSKWNTAFRVVPVKHFGSNDTTAKSRAGPLLSMEKLKKILVWNFGNFTCRMERYIPFFKKIPTPSPRFTDNNKGTHA